MNTCPTCGRRVRGRCLRKAVNHFPTALNPAFPVNHHVRDSDDFLVARRNLQFAHHSLTPDEMQTVDAIIHGDDNADILVTPNHHFDKDGIFRGYRVCFPARSSGVQLPINRDIFHGTTIVEASSMQGINTDIISLVSNPAHCKEVMTALLQRIDAESRGNEPSLNCMPINVDTAYTDGVSGNLQSAGVREQRSVDCQPWKPELPTQIGIYHTYARGWNKDSREHRIYLAVSGGCMLAAESYYNLLLDIGTDVEVDEIVDSEETWWLRSASSRMRCRLLHQLAEAFQITIPLIKDIHAYDDVQMARATTDTIYNDISRMRSGHIAIFSDCVDTTTVRNGIVNIMHPAEGLWVFKGPSRSSYGMTSLGSGWGDQKHCGVFPSGVFKLAKKKQHTNSKRTDGTSGMAMAYGNIAQTEICTVMSRTPSHIIRYTDGGDTANGQACDEYLWYDEEFLETLEDMGYDRDHGKLELMPIIVGLCNSDL